MFAEGGREDRALLSPAHDRLLRRDSATGPVSVPGLSPLPGAAPGPGKASGLSPAPATPGSLLQRALTWGWKGSPCQVRASEGPGSETAPGTSLRAEPSPGHREPLLEGGPPVCPAGSGACPPPWLRQSYLSRWAHPSIHFLSWVKAVARSCPPALRQVFLSGSRQARAQISAHGGSWALGCLVAGGKRAAHSLASLAKVTGVTQKARCPCQPQLQEQRGHRVVTALRPQPRSWGTGEA